MTFRNAATDAPNPAPSVCKVETRHLPADAVLTSEARWENHPRGGRCLAVTLRNDSECDISLHSARVAFPWIETTDPGLRIASGGTTMATWPAQLHAPLEDPRGQAASGMYLLARHDGMYLLAAFLSWNTFWSKLGFESGELVMTADGEDRRLRPGESVSLETVWLTRGDNWHDLLCEYAGEIARRGRRPNAVPPKFCGWSTWDYFGRAWTERDIVENLDEAKRLVPQSNLLQIDGGWWPHRGDYAQVRGDLGIGTMRKLAGIIRERGLTAGIHFDGMRGDLAAQVAREHPEYFLKDQHGAIISVPQLNDGDRLNHIYFDFSHPGACAYMREVARTLRHDWGYDYIKIDFLAFGLAEDIRKRALAADPSRRIAPHDPGMTSVERMHRALCAWREGMGEEAFFLACSAPFGVVLGHADGLRTGYDVFPNFSALRQCAQATAGAFYLNGRAAWNDADYQISRGPDDEDATLVRNRQKQSTLTANEAEMWAIHVGLFGGPCLNSDKLRILRPERQELFQLAARLPSCRRFVPLDFWSRGCSRDDAYHVLLGETEGGRVILALFNWSEVPRSYALEESVAGKAVLKSIAGVDTVPAGLAPAAFEITLHARHAAAFEVSGVSFGELCRVVVRERETPSV